MNKIFAVARYVFKQGFRNRIQSIFVLFAVLAAGSSFVIGELAKESESRMITDFGLVMIELFAFLTIVLSVAVQMFEETELNVISLILVKPIKKYEFVAGKYLGILITAVVNILLMTAVLMGILKLTGADPFEPRIMLSALYIVMEISVLASVAVLAAALSGNIPSALIYFFSIFIIGHETAQLKHVALNMSNGAAVSAINVIYYIFPNLELFNMKDRIYSSGHSGPEYLVLIAAYTVAYIIFSLFVANLLYKTKEF